MRKTISAVPRAARMTGLLAALFATSALAGITPAAAAEPARAPYDARDQVVSDFCNAYPGASSCNDWQHNRGGWSNERYQSFYRDHRYEYGLNTEEAAAAFRRTRDTTAPSQDVGARTLEVPQPAVIGDRDNHTEDCLAAYSSYNRRTDSYTAQDGSLQKCEL